MGAGFYCFATDLWESYFTSFINIYTDFQVRSQSLVASWPRAASPYGERP